MSNISSKELLYKQLQDKLDAQKRLSDPQYQKLLAQERSADRKGVDAYAPLVSAASQAAASMGGSQSQMPKIGIRLAELSRQKPLERVSAESGLDLKLLKDLASMEQKQDQFDERQDMNMMRMASGGGGSGGGSRRRSSGGGGGSLAKSQEEKPEKAINYKENQYKAAGFGKRAVAADEIANSLEKSGYDPTTTKRSIVSSLPEIVGNRFLSDDDQRYDQVQRDFVTAVLRKESGASIPEGEMQTEIKKYFPRTSEGAAVIAQKATSRRRAIAALKAEAAGAWDTVEDIANEQPPKKEPEEPGLVEKAVASPQDNGRVKLRNPKTGNVFSVDKEEAAALIKDGAEEVK